MDLVLSELQQEVEDTYEQETAELGASQDPADLQDRAAELLDFEAGPAEVLQRIEDTVAVLLTDLSQGVLSTFQTVPLLLDL